MPAEIPDVAVPTRTTDAHGASSEVALVPGPSTPESTDGARSAGLQRGQSERPTCHV